MATRQGTMGGAGTYGEEADRGTGVSGEKTKWLAALAVQHDCGTQP